MTCLFLSHRQEDSPEITRRIYNWLSERLLPDSVWLDVVTIPPGANLAQVLHLLQWPIAEHAVILAVIGPRWVTVQNQQGQSRLYDQDDPVRIVIEAALQLKRPILPVLVDDARMPVDLPPELVAGLGQAGQNAITVRASNAEFTQDMDLLIEKLMALEKTFNQCPLHGKNEHVQKVSVVAASSMPLAAQVQPPVFPLLSPPPPIRSTTEGYFNVVGGGAIGIMFVGAVLALFGMSEMQYGFSQLGNIGDALGGLAIFVVSMLMVCGPLGFVFIDRVILPKRNKRRQAIYQANLPLQPQNQAIYEKRRELWDRLYCCSQDKAVFLLDRHDKQDCFPDLETFYATKQLNYKPYERYR